MKVTDVFKNDPLGRQVMEGVKIREMKADHILNSKDEFHQPGEIIPVLEGARRNNRNDNNRNNNNSPRDNSQDSNNSQGVKTRSQTKKVTTAVAVTTGGVRTRARARRENSIIVV